jgi:shikimate dehydrogenase|tara:strand:- start:3885 stop:4697 length:813 start_codon:yes stop_codon:yes gene_type:complete
MTDKYAVIGNPVHHSKSPLIHQSFAKQYSQNMVYSSELIPLNGLEEGLKNLQALGFTGVNVTVPFKEEVWELIENKSEFSALAGAVNTITIQEDGTLYADNTDGVGLCRDLTDNHGIQLNNKRILLLGAGGAARGVIQPLLEQRPAELIIANRTISKAQNIVDHFTGFGDISATGFTAVAGDFDIIINATSASLQGQVPPIPATAVTHKTFCYDMMYSNEDTCFVQWAKQQHAFKSIDGLGMLVEQAAEAFRLWRGIKPETQSVIKLLRT